MGSRLVVEFNPNSSQYHYYTQDQVRSTRVVTDDTGTRVWAEAYDPYGGIQYTWPNNTITPERKFSDKERDEESQLDYFGARYYANGSFRWMSVDPITNPVAATGNPQEWNLYAYCGNNPTSYIDHFGKSYVVFDGHFIFLYSDKDELIEIFEASERVSPGEHFAFPEGVFARQYWTPTQPKKDNRKECAGIGEYGFFSFAPPMPGCGQQLDYAMGMHSYGPELGYYPVDRGGEDQSHMRGYEYATFGCIRIEPWAMEFLVEYDMVDPIKYLIVDHS